MPTVIKSFESKRKEIASYFDTSDSILGTSAHTEIGTDVYTDSVTVTADYPIRHDWKKLIRSGSNANTFMQIDRTTYEAEPVTMSGSQVSYALYPAFDDQGHVVGQYRGHTNNDKRFNYHGNPYGGFGGFSNAPDLDTSAIDNQALIQFYNKARSAQTTEQGGTFLGEIRETVFGLLHPAAALRAFLTGHVGLISKRTKLLKKAYRDGDRDAILRLSRDKAIHSYHHSLGSMVTNTWLEYNYAWRPLVADITDSAEAIVNLPIREPRKRISGKASGNTNSSGDSQLQYRPAGGPARLFWTPRSQKYYECRYYGSVRVRVESDACSKMSVLTQDFGLNMSNFLPTIWNIIPYSFVADYFTNIGDVINALSFPTSEISWVSKATRQGTYYFVGDQYVEQDPSDLATSQGGYIRPGIHGKKTETLIRSDAAGSIGSVSFAFRPLSDLSLRKWLNLGSLGAQLAVYRQLTNFRT